ncbi:histidine phosphatase family protein [bacterium]|nr:histidine phosphatase family protein [bacterium]
MKEVIIMRHAKSSWDGNWSTDHERPLNERGKQDAPKIMEYIVKRDAVPEIVYSSDSQRTIETSQGLQSVAPNLLVNFTNDLYHATADEILLAIQSAENKYKRIMILAHNPGVTDVFFTLAKVNIDNVPTSGAGLLQFNVDRFSEIKEGSGELEWFIYPKGLD